jgi:hypothetical protein
MLIKYKSIIYAFYLKISDLSHIWTKRGHNDNSVYAGVNKTAVLESGPISTWNLLARPFLPKILTILCIFKKKSDFGHIWQLI